MRQRALRRELDVLHRQHIEKLASRFREKIKLCPYSKNASGDEEQLTGEYLRKLRQRRLPNCAFCRKYWQEKLQQLHRNPVESAVAVEKPLTGEL